MTDRVVTVEQMRAIERAAMASGVSEWELMQRAGQGAAVWVARMAAGRPVAVLCGPGNNGGDGYVIAEKLRQSGHEVSVVAPGKPTTATARHAVAEFAGTISDGIGASVSVVVDCLFGYGLSRPLQGEYANLLEELKAKNCFKIAIDVPSAVESDSGAVLGPIPQYDLTLALGAWKQAHFLMPASSHMGAKRLVEIGLDSAECIARVSSRPTIQPPVSDSHKYRRGMLGIVSGDMPGASILAAEAALRSGAGYVKLLGEQGQAPAELVIERDVSTALQDDRFNAFLIGPGLGRTEAASHRLDAALGAGHPVVLDADALYLLMPDAIEGIDVTALCLTPHEGELARLCESFGVTKQRKLDRLRALHDVTGLTILAKGPDTVLAKEGTLRFFGRGSSWLSAAGTGDVLAGIIASRLAVHAEPGRACEEGVWLHQEAARLAGPAFTSADLAKSLRQAMACFL